MAWDFKKEIGRKTIHLLSILFLIIYAIFSSYFNHKIALLILSFILIVLIELEYIRLELRKKIPIVSSLWKYKRKKEKSKLGGEVFFLIGAIICLAVFNTTIAFAAILMTTFGDLTASLIGKRFHKIKLFFRKDKALEGVLAELIVNLIIGYMVFYYFGLVIWPIIIVMALTATIVETIVSKMDDNLLIPLFSGFNGQITLYILTLANYFIRPY